MRVEIKCKDYFLDAQVHLSEEKNCLQTIIISHGFRGSKDGGGRAIVLAEKLKQYFHVVRFDFSPLGSLTKQTQELHSVIEYVQTNITEKVILFGRSMGACASLAAVEQNKNITALILWSMPFDLSDTFKKALGEDNFLKIKKGMDISLYDQWGSCTIKSSFYKDLLSYDLKNKLQQLPSDMPVLFVQAEYDELINKADFKKEFDLCTANKTLCLIKGADHRFINGFDDALLGVRTWLLKNCL